MCNSLLHSTYVLIHIHTCTYIIMYQCMHVINCGYIICIYTFNVVTVHQQCYQPVFSIWLLPIPWNVCSGILRPQIYTISVDSYYLCCSLFSPWVSTYNVSYVYLDIHTYTQYIYIYICTLQWYITLLCTYLWIFYTFK